ncbi:hypothetical protein CRG98_027904 [Punica granatum]|uniref:Pectinesterase n=1 Tax=Punica granatum TaxID=22663 RepID=A0A2I0J678_PUNGR|nr:hypothetical protein CRG98_027904 [Punica granatum]
MNTKEDKRDQISRESGFSNFTTLQEAIGWVPTINTEWIRIHVKPGVYKEKLTIPREKPFIYLEGEGGLGTTSIKWDDHGHVDNSYTFTLLAENFLASRITFKNPT